MNEENVEEKKYFSKPKLAGFWRRFFASIIDVLILTASSGLVIYYIFLTVGGLETSIFVGVIIWWLYFALMESSDMQATVGKKAIGIIVTDLDEKPISFGKATVRHFSKYLSILVLFMGFFMVALTKEKQGLHDIIAGCLVLNKL